MIRIEETVAYSLAEGSAQAAKGFVAALKQASAHIGRNPATGSLRYAHVEIWRVLHGRRDLSEWLQMPATTLAS